MLLASRGPLLPRGGRRYADRVGENYFAAHRERHRWKYFPRLTRDEAVLIKCWDSRGRDFSAPPLILLSTARTLTAMRIRVRHASRTRPQLSDPAPVPTVGQLETARGFPPPPASEAIPATFSLHTAFEDPATPEGAPDRESIEVRTVAFFE